jgi:hypothetical protein
VHPIGDHADVETRLRSEHRGRDGGGRERKAKRFIGEEGGKGRECAGKVVREGVWRWGGQYEAALLLSSEENRIILSLFLLRIHKSVRSFELVGVILLSVVKLDVVLDLRADGTTVVLTAATSASRADLDETGDEFCESSGGGSEIFER